MARPFQTRHVLPVLASLVLAAGCEDGTSPLITDPRLVRSVAAGSGHTGAITGDHALYCWGSNLWGEVGAGAEADRVVHAPVEIELGDRVETVSTGSSHSCAMTAGGETYCWGTNSGGTLGDGTTTDRSSPVRVLGPPFEVVVAGGSHTCGLTVDGSAYCWGWNDRGQLGDGTTELRTEPMPVATSARFVELAAGAEHTCGTTTGGRTLCWGGNPYGELGDGSTETQRLEPVEVRGDARYRAIHAGIRHTCGLTGSGVAHCWGWNAYGQLGDGTATDRAEPGPVSGSLRFNTLSTGYHTCGITDDGDTYCWGPNSSGQLGTGDRSHARVPTRVATSERFRAVTAGSSHSCAATPAGALFCWGENDLGQLGDGGISLGWLTPVAVWRW